MLAAEKKAGKTTLALNLAASLADGKPFLGCKVEPLSGRVAFLNYEMSEWQFTDWARDLEIERPDRIAPLNLRGVTTPFHDERFQDELANWLMRWQVEVIIIDPVAGAWRGLVDDANNNVQVGEFTYAIDGIKQLAGVTEAVLAHHFGRKQHAEGQEHGRGATRLEDWMDVGWYLTRDGRRRSLRAEGRDVDVEAFDLDYDQATRRLSAGQVRRERKEDEGALAVVAAVYRSDKSELLAGEVDEAVIAITNRQRKVNARQAAIQKGWLKEARRAGRAKAYTLTTEGEERIKADVGKYQGEPKAEYPPEA